MVVLECNKKFNNERVYLAHYKDEKVAVKIIKNPQNKNCTNTLKKEIEILEDLHHPRLIKLLGHNEVEI